MMSSFSADCNLEQCESIKNVLKLINTNHDWITSTQNKIQKNNIDELENWLKNNNIWNKLIMDQLLNKKINSLSKLQSLPQSKFDEILRKARVDIFAQLKNQIDKMLIKFEKLRKKINADTDSKSNDND